MKKRGKIYALLLCVMMLVATSTMVYADFKTTYFEYKSQYPGFRYESYVITKSNASSGIGKYLSGSVDRMYFELWGAAEGTFTYSNYTAAQLYNGSYVKYRTASEGSYTMIPNLIYETLGKGAKAKLKAYIMGIGSPSGEWSPNTN